MEIIKKDTNTEFDVIYSDGTRKQVNLRPEALDFLKQLAAPVLCSLAGGAGIRSLIESVPNVVAITRADHDFLHGCGRERQQAAFRLGQMDMQASIADMLEDLADGTQGDVCTTLTDAVQRVRDLKVCDTVKEETSETD